MACHAVNVGSIGANRGLGWSATMGPNLRSRMLQHYGEQELNDVCGMLAVPPLSTSLRVNTVRCSREELMEDLKAELLKLAQDTGRTYGNVEPHPQIPDCILIVPKTKEAEHIERNDKEIVVSRKCAESVLRGSHIFVPGIIASSPWVSKGDDVTVLCDVHDRVLRGAPTHLLSTGKLDPKKMKGSFAQSLDWSDPKVQKEYRAKGEGAPREPGASVAESLPEGIVVIGRGIMNVDRREIWKTEEGIGCTVQRCVFSAPPLNGVMPDRIYVQNLPSMMVGHLLEPREGERILDMCSSPGGKTTHVAALLKGTGEVIALDRTAAKVSIVVRHAEELGLHNVRGFKADSSELLRELFGAESGGQEGVKGKGKGKGKGKSDEDGGSQRTFFEEESFDRIVLDPPCTALGIRPRLKVDLPDGELQTAAGYQRRMLHNAIRLLKVGGRMTYSTCTLHTAENELNVAWALKAYPCLRLAEPAIKVGGAGRQNAGLTEVERHKVQRFGPGTGQDTNGFFVAVFDKVARVTEDMGGSGGAGEPPVVGAGVT